MYTCHAICILLEDDNQKYPDYPSLCNYSDLINSAQHLQLPAKACRRKPPELVEGSKEVRLRKSMDKLTRDCPFL